ncbi:hypothetical protein BKA64DRAFT_661851 [Cadophora sp. MPI-SDFR-AT-0126]|nr:hypothetical protein BKA64DRAFT_661851 [Leotiomycetes sp. MPI-SDFR-AT-0126]
MGTRGLLGFIIKGKRHGAYNHFDSYPSGLGQDIVAFILGLIDEEIKTMAARVAEITWVSRTSPPTKEQQEYYESLDFSNLRVSEQRLDDWYCLLHKVQGAAALPQILNGKLKHLEESVDFLQDGLFCEWAYFIDFENEKLEAWKGESRESKPIGEVTFEELKGEGKEYMERIEKMGCEEDEEDEKGV